MQLTNSLMLITAVAACWASHSHANENADATASIQQQVTLTGVNTPQLHVDGLHFKDLNRSGTLEPYEDWRLPAQQRVQDLLARMTLAEKAGTMVHAIPDTNGTPWVAGGKWSLTELQQLILNDKITSFINELDTDPADMARQANQAQAIAEGGRLGIPLSFSSDPRNLSYYSSSRFVASGQFSQWPLATGLAASDDPDIARRSGIAARLENRAVGIHIQLGPSMDLASDPRWARLNESFGRNAERNGRMAQAYIEGLQDGSTGLHPHSVVAVAKHWGGYGANPDGFDGLNHYGRYLDLRDASMEERLRPFQSAFAANVGTVMTAYSVPPPGLMLNGFEQPLLQVGAAFSAQLVQQLLRQRQGYQGVIMSDWFVVDDCDRDCVFGNAVRHPSFTGFGTDWGVEGLSKHQRYQMAVQAGIDQFGGNNEPHYLVDLVRQGALSEAQLDASVGRILLQKFQLGLFENAQVDVTQAPQIVGNPELQQWARQAQQHAVVLLKNQDGILPLTNPPGTKVFLSGISPQAARQHGLEVVSSPQLADLSLIRLQAPYQTLHPHHVIGAVQHEGSLAFAEADLQLLRHAANFTPVIVSVFMDRPAIVQPLLPSSTALLADFGISDEALLALMSGPGLPNGTLPFALPSAMDEVRAR